MMQKFAQMKKMISLNDSRIKQSERKEKKKKKNHDPHEIKEREV